MLNPAPLLVVLVLLSTGSVSAQTPAVSEEKYNALLEYARKIETENKSLRQSWLSVNTPVYDGYSQFLIKRFEYHTQLTDEARITLQYQRFLGLGIFLIVSTIIICALIFSWKQLAAGLTIPTQSLSSNSSQSASNVTQQSGTGTIQSPATRNPQAQVPLTNNTFEAELTKLTVNTSVIGVVILAMSLVFFYIYIDKVYNYKLQDPFDPVATLPEQPVPGSTIPAATTETEQAPAN